MRQCESQPLANPGIPPLWPLKISVFMQRCLEIVIKPFGTLCDMQFCIPSYLKLIQVSVYLLLLLLHTKST